MNVRSRFSNRVRTFTDKLKVQPAREIGRHVFDRGEGLKQSIVTVIRQGASV